jgi:transcriptional regulator with XRE-family HTH domain
MASIKAEFGRTVRALRTAAGYSQEGFADAIKVTRTYMGKLERGLGNPTLEMIGRIARGLKISLAKLFAEIEKGTG